jgi:hypothetical protein
MWSTYTKSKDTEGNEGKEDKDTKGIEEKKR